MNTRTVELGDGSYQLRPLAPGDEPRLQDFFYSHTPESIHYRYGYMVTQMTGERAHELVAVDQSRDCALALFADTPAGPVIHAVARYCLDGDGRGAEIAFIVRETKQRLGMASTLVRELVATARERGLEHVWAQVLRDNAPALQLLVKLGFQKTGIDEGNIILRLTLAQKQSPPRKKQQGKRR